MGTDAIVMRSSEEGSPLYATKCVDPIIINAGDGAHEHPTQALLDMYSILEHKPSLEGLKVVIVGDIMHSRVARSNIYGLKTMGADVHLAGPRTLVYPELEKMGVTVHHDVREAVKDADVVIGAVLIPGAKAPKLVTDEMVKQMRPGSVIVDVAVDQGGVIETADRVTTHDEPVYEKYGVLHYAVANIPGAVARTSTIALTNVTLPYIEALAGKGFAQAIAEDEGLRQGVTTYKGYLTSLPVAQGLDKDHTSINELV